MHFYNRNAPQNRSMRSTFVTIAAHIIVIRHTPTRLICSFVGNDKKKYSTLPPLTPLPIDQTEDHFIIRKTIL